MLEILDEMRPAMRERLHDGKRVKTLYDLTKACSDPLAQDQDDKLARWAGEVQKTPAADLVILTSRLSSGEGEYSRNLKALREAVISEVERKKRTEYR